MNPLDLFNQVKELIENKDFSAAKTFVEENKDQLGTTLAKLKLWSQDQKDLKVLLIRSKASSNHQKTPEKIRCLFVFFS